MPFARRAYVQTSLLFVAITIIVVASVGIHVARDQARYLTVHTRESVRVATRVYGDLIVTHLLIEQLNEVEETLLRLADLPHVDEIALLNPDGTILIRVMGVRNREGKHPVSYGQGRYEVSPGGNHIADSPGGIVVWQQLQSARHLGWLRVAANTRDASEVRNDVLIQMARAGIIWVTVGVCVLLLVLWRPMVILRELSLFSRTLGRNKGAQVDEHRITEEIRELCQSLNVASLELEANEQRLQNERARLAATIEGIADGIVSCDENGRVILVNPAAEVLTGIGGSDSVGAVLEDILSVEVSTREGTMRLSWGDYAAGRSFGVTEGEGAEVVAAHGVRRNVIVKMSSIAGGLVITLSDITEQLALRRKEQELSDQLRHSQKLEVIGQLAGGIAHDFNNILTAIVGYGHMAQQLTPDVSPASALIAKMLHSADRAASLTRSLLTFSRKERVQTRPFNVVEAVTSVERIIHRLVGENIDVRLTTKVPSLIVNGDQQQLDQVLINAASNARDAMPDGGILSIAVDEVASPPELAGGGRAVLISVADTGKGIPTDILPHIFEPFFTTKGQGKGTGLGLSIVHGIIQQHRGCIHVRSDEGVGTTFDIVLPLSHYEELPAHEVLPPPTGGSETILVVEDEEDVRQITQDILEAEGYTVHSAEDGQQALHIFSQIPRVDLVLSDVLMPGMTGKTLTDKLRMVKADIRIVYMSGYTWDIISEKGIVQDPSLDLIMKPFSREQLLRKVREILDRPRRITES